MKAVLILTTAALTTLAGCATAPAPICNREAQVWDKFETIEDVCVVPKVKVPAVIPGGGKGPEVTPVDPTDPEEPVDPEDEDDHEDDHDDHEGDHKSKSDNSDANGKGGNHHYRYDKDKPSQEVAEDNKED